jgi:hypothetical protein
MIKPGAVKERSVKPYLITIVCLTVVIVLLNTAGNYPLFIERYYANGFYPFISTILHILLGWIPFSVGDLFYTGIILHLLYFIWQFVRCIVKKRYGLLGFNSLKLIIGIQLFITAFYLLWGMNYFRPPAATILNLKDEGYTLNELLYITNLLIDSTNAHRSVLQSADTLMNNAAIYHTAEKAIKQVGSLNKALYSSYPAAKSALFTPFTNYMGVTGYFTPFTGEAQVNYAMPLVNKSVTACHEMAHQMGFAREDEANFVGFLAGMKSNDRLLQYSAYYLAMQEFMQQVRRRDTVLFNQLKSKISVPVKNDIKADRLYWRHYQNQIGYITGIIYDNFLKANNQPEGLLTYNRMINLTMAYYRQNGLVKAE